MDHAYVLAEERKGEEFVEVTTLFLRKVNPTTESCIFMGGEYRVAIKNYGTAMFNQEVLLLNILYHSNEIAHVVISIHEIRDIEDWAVEKQSYYILGRKLGKIFYLIFYDIGDYDWPGIDMNYPVEFDEP